MATAVRFHGFNKQLEMPEGVDGHGLPVWQGTFANGLNGCVSRWKLDDDERRMIARDGMVWLYVISGMTQPPVSITTHSPFETTEQINKNEQAQREPEGIEELRLAYHMMKTERDTLLEKLNKK